MNIQEIDKWLDNEYGMSYTKLEELHNYFFEKYTDQKEEIERLNNIIGEATDRAIHIQKTFGYVLDDLIYLLMHGSDKE